MVKTVREKDITFKLDEPISELFSQMRKVSQKAIEGMNPHPYYLEVSFLDFGSNDHIFWSN